MDLGPVPDAEADGDGTSSGEDQQYLRINNFVDQLKPISDII